MQTMRKALEFDCFHFHCVDSSEYSVQKMLIFQNGELKITWNFCDAILFFDLILIDDAIQLECNVNSNLIELYQFNEFPECEQLHGIYCNNPQNLILTA